MTDRDFMTDGQVVELLMDKEIALEEKLQILYAAGQFCSALTLLDQQISKVREPKKIITSISRAMNTSYRWGKADDTCRCSSCSPDYPNVSTRLLANAAMLIMQMPAMQRQQSAFSSSMLSIVMNYPEEHELRRLVLDSMVRKRLTKDQVRGVLSCYQIVDRHAEFLKEWIERTPYALDFQAIYIDVDGCDSQLVLLLERALREKRFPKTLEARHTFVGYLFDVLPQSCADALSRHCLDTKYDWRGHGGSWQGERLAHYQLSYFNSGRTWPMIQHQRYLNYALCLASIEGVTPYVIVWIIEDWLIPTTSVTHLRGVRMAESVIKAYMSRAAALIAPQRASLTMRKKRAK